MTFKGLNSILYPNGSLANNRARGPFQGSFVAFAYMDNVVLKVGENFIHISFQEVYKELDSFIHIYRFASSFLDSYNLP